MDVKIARSKRRRKICRICCIIASPTCFIVSCICAAGGTVLFVFFPTLLANMVQQQVVIQPGSTPYKQLKDPSLPVYQDIYFYNLTNPEKFAKGEEQPNVTELGPYSYREYRLKFYNSSSFLDGNNRLEYTDLKTFDFSPNTSGPGLKDDDIICTVNLPMIGAIAKVLQLESIVERLFGVGILKGIFFTTNAKLYICQPATNLIFKYSDNLIRSLHSNAILKLMKMNLPTDYVSIQLNASSNGSIPSIINTGRKDINKIGEFFQWQGRETLGLWPEESANMINGTEGIMFRPNLKKGDNLTAFVDAAYRSFPLQYSGTTKIKGLEAFKYTLPSIVFDSAFKNPENARWGSWCPDGLIYLGVLQQPNPPVFGSKAHFLDADPVETRDKIQLPQPDRAKDDTILYVHPLIGVTLQFQRVLQMNIQINRTSRFSELQHINGTMYYPILYIKEHTEMTDDFKNYLMKNGLLEVEIATYSAYSVFGFLLFIAVVCILCSVLMCTCAAKLSSKRIKYERINSDT